MTHIHWQATDVMALSNLMNKKVCPNGPKFYSKLINSEQTITDDESNVLPFFPVANLASNGLNVFSQELHGFGSDNVSLSEIVLPWFVKAKSITH